jgi:hypothetical protein
MARPTCKVEATVSSVLAIQRSAVKAWDEFLLRAAEDAVGGRSAPQREYIARYCRVARQLSQTADRLDEPDDSLAALVLYRQCAVLMAAALAKSTDSRTTPDLGPDGAWLELRSTLSRESIVVPDHLAVFEKLLVGGDPKALDALDPEELLVLRDDARAAVAWLTAFVDPRSLQQVRTARYVRVAIASMAVGLGLFLSARWVAAPRDLALHKPAIASSQWPGSPPAAGVDNGQIEASFGVHTKVEEWPWVMIDLGNLRSIREVRVYNRGDAYFDEGLPLVLEFSSDGKTWIEVARRTTPYSQSNPWVATTHGSPGRYVRVQVPRHGYIALSEIEVF